MYSTFHDTHHCQAASQKIKECNKITMWAISKPQKARFLRHPPHGACRLAQSKRAFAFHSYGSWASRLCGKSIDNGQKFRDFQLYANSKWKMAASPCEKQVWHLLWVFEICWLCLHFCWIKCLNHIVLHTGRIKVDWTCISLAGL